MDNIEAMILLIHRVQFLKRECGEAAAVCFMEMVERRLGVEPGSMESNYLRENVGLKPVKKSGGPLKKVAALVPSRGDSQKKRRGGGKGKKSGGPSVINKPKSKKSPKGEKSPKCRGKKKLAGKRKKQKL